MPNPASVQLIQVAVLEQKLWSKWKEMPLRDQKRSPAEGPGKEKKEEEKQSRQKGEMGREKEEEEEGKDSRKEGGRGPKKKNYKIGKKRK